MSARRVVVRASIRFAILAQAISSTNVESAINIFRPIPAWFWSR